MVSASNRTHIAAFTHNYLFRGVVATGSKRLSEVLNDRLSAFLEVAEVRIYHLAQPEKPVGSAATLFLKKQRVEAVAILKEETAFAPRRLYGFVAKERRPATLFLRDFEVRGQLHLQGRPNTAGALVREGEQFIPLTDATLVATLNPKVKLSAATILLREAALDGFFLTEAES